MRLIDAEKTKEHKFSEVEFERYHEIIYSGRATTDDVIYAYKVGYNEAIDNIADFEPTADVRPNVKGKWIRHKDRACWYCSECTADDYYAYIRDCDSGEYELQDNFCPNCGADMRKETEDDND